MLEIDNVIVSLDVVEKKFCCDLAKCKGVCCVEGDSGAPLKEQEKELIEKHYDVYKQYMTPEAIKEVEKQGFHVIDSDGDLVTPIINNKECVYTYTENGFTFCAIEKAYREGLIDWKKPESCELYPIRVKDFDEFKAMNYDKWKICQPARELGFKKGLPIYKFLKEPLIKYFGESWYENLEIAVDEAKKQGII